MRRRQVDRGIERQRDIETGRRGDWATGRNFRLIASPPRRLVAPSLGLFLFSLFIPLIANAQTGEITGRVVSEDGGGIPNMTVYMRPIGPGQRVASNNQPEIAVTDEGGNFKFTGLASRQYSVNVSAGKGYINRPVPASERTPPRAYSPGDHVTFTLVRGGVITGRVTTSTGEPMIGVQVSAMSVRKNSNGNSVRDFLSSSPRTTDDRGVYRFYGLAPGTYVVYTRGNMVGSPISAYDGYAPTYHPSSPRETAAEIAVTSGGEATGVDIRYLGERGHTISGVVNDPSLAAPNARTSVALYNASTGFQAGTSSVRPGEAQSGFAILGVTDGEYEIIARRFLAENEYFTSPPHRITVRGADLSGIELRLAPTAMVSGKVVEASPKVCESDRKSSSEDMIVSARRATKAAPSLWFLRPYLYTGSMNDKGEFTINRLDPDNYFIIARMPDENRYVKSIAAPAASARRSSLRPVATYDVARSGLTVKAGDRMTGLIVTIADGAASLRGKVAPEDEGSRLPARIIVHLVPAETAAANDLLRYGEVATGKDNAFEFKNMSPGKYRLLVRAAPDDEPTDSPPAPVAWDANERAKLRKEAEKMNVEVELKPCQRVKDQVVKYQ